ncbi:hypothetical protein [Mesorhizobium sp. M0520]|uniref:hypothetical protein n=1 Tax=Mesorhizobium sp. M0520 TaxID=2956957 RepID=UPI003335B3DA
MSAPDLIAELRAWPRRKKSLAVTLMARAADHIAKLEAERDRCHARLEIDHHFVMVGENQLERREIPVEQRADEPDGIEARDCTIALQDSRIASLEAEREALREALAPFAAFAEKAERFVQGRAVFGGSPIMPTKNFRLADFQRAARALLPRQDRLSGKGGE